MTDADRPHVQRQVVKVEVHVGTEAVHGVVFDDAVGQVQVPVLVQEQPLPLDQDALDQDVEFVQRELPQVLGRLLVAVDPVPDVPGRTEASQVDVRRIDPRHAQQVAVHQLPQGGPLRGRLLRDQVADQHLTFHSRHRVRDGGGDLLKSFSRCLNHYSYHARIS